MDGFFVVHDEEYERLHCHLRAAERQGIRWHARSIAQGIGYEWETQRHIVLELSQSKIGRKLRRCSQQKNPTRQQGFGMKLKGKTTCNLYETSRFLYIQIISHYYVFVNGVGAKIHTNSGNVLLIRRRMVLTSKAHVIEIFSATQNTPLNRAGY